MMDPIAIEPPIVVERISQTPELFDLADWLRGQFPSAIAPSDWLADPARLPVIEW
jgi:hypothetical protein